MNNKLLRKADRFVKLGKLGPAKALCRKFLISEPDHAEALYQLGSIYLLEKKHEESSNLLKQVLHLNPNHIGALNNMGLVYLEHEKDLKAAERCFKQVIEINAGHVNSLMNLGNIYSALRQFENAEKFYRRALTIDPHNGSLLNNLAGIFVWRGLHDEAIECYRKALEFLPDDPKILANLMIFLTHIGNKEEALKFMARIMKLDDPGEALFPVFCGAKTFCLWEEIKRILSDVFRLIYEGRAVSDSFKLLNLSLLATPDVSHETLFEIHQITGQAIDALRERPAYEAHEKAMRSTRRWRVGYLSPNFRNHVVDIFLRGLINSHDRDRFEVYCYSNTKKEDEITEHYRNAASVFVNVTQLSDWQLAERIHADGIHFLVDLAGFTQDSRISALSYRPAPIQITYMGYPYTSGLTSVDYIVSDPYLDSPKNNDFFTERQLRLPECGASFGSLKEQEIEADIPWKRNRLISFGSLINTYKLNPEVIRVWSQILNRVPGSRIIINHPNCDLETTRLNILKEFSRHGVNNDRVIIVWKKHPSGSHLRYYNDIDIALDSFPLTGGMSTIDATWMGVPVITLVGEIYPFRASYSILSNIGIEVADLIAFSEEEYVEKAVALAGNPSRISELHQAIPQSLKHSILCDPIRLTKQVEAAYIEGWNGKFKECPVHAEQEEEVVQFVPVLGGVEIAVEGSLEDINTYVLKEQEGWFELEYPFVQNLVQPGMRVLDISAGVGSYAIPLAKKLGKNGRMWATTRTAKEAWLLEKSRKRNHLRNLTIIVKDEKTLKLDLEMASHSLSEIDFIRLNINATELKLLMNGKELFSQNSPLIMFEIRQDDSVDTSLVPVFKSLGYDPYRLVPGLDLLVPFTSDDDLDTFALNLFCCKNDRADFLAKQELLIRKIQPVSELPGIQIKDWQKYIGSLPYASALIENWIDVPPESEEWETYMTALNLFARAKDKERSAEAHYASLHTSYGILATLVKAKPTLPRLLSLCRAMIEIGKREAAVSLLNQVFNIFEAGEKIHMNEPFIALSDEYAAIDPGDRLAEWFFASILDQRERCRAFSSYFTGEESLPVLEAIVDTGFYGPEIERRIELIKMRYNNCVNIP